MKPFTKLLIAVLVLVPCLAFAGDAPIVLMHGWGIGSIDGRLMFYLGDGHYCVTPIRLGLRWLVLYAFVAAVIAFSIYGRRQRDTAA